MVRAELDKRGVFYPRSVRAGSLMQVRQNPEDDYSRRNERQEMRRRHRLTSPFR